VATCRRLIASLSCEEAFAVLDPFFVETKKLFVERGLVRCRETRLLVEEEVHDTPRHFAGCTDDGREIIAAPQLAEMPVETVVAIMAHEFGHSADFLYPSRFVVADGELVSVFEGERRERRVKLDDLDQRGAYNLRKQWETRNPPAVEETADAVAEYVTHREIRYAGPCMLQTYGPGRRRPKELR